MTGAEYHEWCNMEVLSFGLVLEYTSTRAHISE